MSLQPGISRKEALQNLLRSLGEILPIAQQEGVLVAIEPVFTHAMNTPEQARWVLDQMASPNLGIIFDPVNVLNVQEIDSQRQLWERCFECFGDRIAAVHMKGADLCDGEIVPVPYTDSALDYPYLFQQLKALGKDLPILREEVDPAHAREDVAFLRSFL